MRSRKRSPKRSIACSIRRMSIRSLPRPRITRLDLWHPLARACPGHPRLPATSFQNGQRRGWPGQTRPRGAWWKGVADVIASHSLAARTLDRVDDRRGAQRRDDGRQMLDVGDLDVDQDFEEIDRTVGDLEVADIGALVADCGG